MMSSKSTIFAVASVGIFLSVARERLWPWGLADSLSWEDRPKFSPIDFDNNSLKVQDGKFKRIYERVQEGKEPLLKGPETVVFDNEGQMYTLSEEGFLVGLSNFQEEKADGGTSNLMADTRIVSNLGPGRPLGGKFDSENTLYLADSHLGLTRLQNPGSGASKVELVASEVMDNGTMTQILYANDVAIGPKSGLVYFTDSTEIAPDRIETRSWDTMYMSKMDAMRGKRTGRLLKYDPSVDEVTVLARNLYFPNGIAVDKDETFLYFVETFTLRLMKFSLEDGSISTIVQNELTGFPDGGDCGWPGITTETSASCFAVMPSAMVPIMKMAVSIPPPYDSVFRSLIMALPKTLAPPVKKYGGVVEVDPINGGIIRLLQDPTGEDAAAFAGVTVQDNKLYLGSLKNNYIGVYDLA